MMPVVVTASTPLELSLLVQSLGAVPAAEAAHLKAYRCKIGDRVVILAQTGIGKVNAASATTLLLERFQPELVINTGCGGAFSGSGLSVGDLAFASSESFADEGVETPQGWRALDLIGIPVCEVGGARIFNTITVSPQVAEDAVALAHREGEGGVLGPFLTVSTCSGTATRGERLLQRFPGICENMEGAAVAQVALLYGVDFLEVRGISNMVEDRDLSRWDLRGAVARAQGFLARYLQYKYA